MAVKRFEVSPIFSGTDAGANRFMTSGELAASGGSGTVTSITAGGNVTLQPATITTTGSIGVVPNPTFVSIVDTGNLLVSGQTTVFAPIVTNTGSRYVTSGEMTAGISGAVLGASVGVLARQLTPVTASGTALVPLFTPTIPANTLGANGYVCLHLIGSSSDTQAAQGSSGVFLRVTYGSTVLYSGQPFLVYSGGITDRSFELTQTLASLNSSSSQVAFADIKAPNTIGGSASTNLQLSAGGQQSSFEDSTVDKTLGVYVGHQLFGVTTKSQVAWVDYYVASGTVSTNYVIVASGASIITPGSNIVMQPNPLTLSGSIAVTPNPTFASIVDTGSLLVSGSTVVFAPIYTNTGARYIVSGEASSGGVTSVGTGSNLVASPTTLTTTGTIALSPNISVASVVDTGNLLVSGTTVAFAPVYQGAQTGASRYVVSGELSGVSIIGRQTSPLTVSGTTPTQLFAVTIPGNTLGANGYVSLYMIGSSLSTQVATASSNVAFRVTYGNTVLFSGQPYIVYSGGITARSFELTQTVAGIGSTSSQVAFAKISAPNTISGMVATDLQLAAGGQQFCAEDSTANKTLAVYVNHDAFGVTTTSQVAWVQGTR